jgi:hypothetical protein
MGCDYFIDSYLEIEHSQGVSYCTLPLIHGYYCDIDCGLDDSDDDESDIYYNSIEYKTLCEIMEKICLTPKKPLVIYSNHSFINRKLEIKYFPIIQKKIKEKYVEKNQRYKDTGTFTSIEEVLQITKKEDRYER